MLTLTIKRTFMRKNGAMLIGRLQRPRDAAIGAIATWHEDGGFEWGPGCEGIALDEDEQAELIEFMSTAADGSECSIASVRQAVFPILNAVPVDERVAFKQ